MKKSRGGLTESAPGTRVLSTPHFERLAERAGPRLLRQVRPDPAEDRGTGMRDPLGEERSTVVDGLVHRYPDRVLMLPTFRCFAYCRFCTRKRKWGETSGFEANLGRIFGYIRGHREIREVIISGGDPLTLPDPSLSEILNRAARIPHVRTLRIATRCLTFAPERITPRLAAILAGPEVVYFTTHFNHPAEISARAREKCRLLRKNGIVLINQSVLLKGINDDEATLRELNRKLLEAGIKPYALHQLDLTVSTQHFKVPVKKGIRLIRGLRKQFTGIGIPHFVLDRPGGKGKIFPVFKG